MKFSSKVFFCTIIVIALAMGFGGYFLIKSNFDAAIEREIALAFDEGAVLCFTFETITLNIPLKYDILQDETVAEIASSLETGRSVRVSADDGRTLYSGPGFTAGENAAVKFFGNHTDGAEGLYVLDESDVVCKIIRSAQAGRGTYAERRYAYAAFPFKPAGRPLYLETVKDVTSIFDERDRSVGIYRSITIATIIVGAFFMYFISIWLTRPIRALAGAARDMAGGNYGRRAPLAGADELGLLTVDFNRMADSLQDRMIELREEAAARARFVSAFSHELKTPLTTIIGYADALRSYKLDGEAVVVSADYIYKEGKRLEEMSLRLLELIVLKRSALELKDTPVSAVMAPLEDMFGIYGNIEIVFDEAYIYTEASLLKTVLINLIDNAIKYSDKARPIAVKGLLTGRGYMFSVTDHGIGCCGGGAVLTTKRRQTARKQMNRQIAGLR